jgi:hypothetical protein
MAAPAPLLTKDSINIAGHKFPIALVGGVAAIAGVLLVLRSRKAGGSVASVGQPPTGSSPYGSSFGSDNSAALANIQQQLGSLTTKTAADQWVATGRSALPVWGSSDPGIPILSSVTGGTLLGYDPLGSSIQLANSAPITGTFGGQAATYYQVNEPGGGVGYILAQDLLGLHKQ